MNAPSPPAAHAPPLRPSHESEPRHLVLVVRADPIICGHSTEARNLAEAAISTGFASVHIVTYPLDALAESGLPLKPLDSILPYSPGIEVLRPEAVGNYKLLDGRLGYAIAGKLVELLHQLRGTVVLMDLYLVPHGQMVRQAVDSFRGLPASPRVVTIGEAVGSDITNVVSQALASGRLGAAQLVLSNFLAHDLPVAVSHFTRDLIVEAGAQVDAALGTRFAEKLAQRVGISYPAIDTAAYLAVGERPAKAESILNRRGLKRDDYVLFLSRLAAAKGVDDLVAAYRASELYGRKKLVICGNGPAREEIAALAAGDPSIRLFDDVSDAEKGALMHACFAYCLPSKARPEFVETFGIAVAEKMLAGGPGPVITTRTGGIPEATGGHCLEHEAGDRDSLREALNRAAFMSESEREALSRRAREYAMRFDQASVLESLLERSLLAV